MIDDDLAHKTWAIEFQKHTGLLYRQNIRYSLSNINNDTIFIAGVLPDQAPLMSEG